MPMRDVRPMTSPPTGDPTKLAEDLTRWVGSSESRFLCSLVADCARRSGEWMGAAVWQLAKAIDKPGVKPPTHDLEMWVELNADHLLVRAARQAEQEGLLNLKMGVVTPTQKLANQLLEASK